MLHETNGRTQNSFEARFHTYKIYFYRRKTKEENARRSLNTKKTNKLIKNLQQYSASEPIDIENSVENTGLKFGSDGTETEHLESEGLAQTGDEIWEHQLKLKDDEMSCLREKWQTKERELNKKYKCWKINFNMKEVPGSSWNY